MQILFFYRLWKSLEWFFKLLMGASWLIIASSIVILLFQLIGWHQYDTWIVYTLGNMTGSIPYLPFEYQHLQPVISAIFKMPLGWMSLLTGLILWLLLMFGYSYTQDKAQRALPDNRRKHLIHHNLAAS